MASDADQRVMPSSAIARDAEPPRGNEAPNLFAPITVGNRITGNTRVHRKRLQAQLSPGSNYDYGREETVYSLEEPQPLPVNEEETIGYGKSVPPTFLRRTLTDPYPEAAPRSVAGYAPGAIPFDTAYANMAAVQAAAAVQIYGEGLNAPLPFAFANRMDEAARMGAQSAGYGLGAYGIAMPAQKPNREPQTPVLAADAQEMPAFLATDGTVAPAYASVRRRKTPPFPPQAGQEPSGSANGGEPIAFTFDDPARQPTPPSPALENALPQTSAPSAETQEPTAGEPIMDRAAGRRGGRRVDRLREKQLPPESLAELPPMAQPVFDSWAAMGWKAPEPAALESTAVWRSSDLSMFERSAFEEPLNPFSNPVEGATPYLPSDRYPFWGGLSPAGPETGGNVSRAYSESGMDTAQFPPYPAQTGEGYFANLPEEAAAGENILPYENGSGEPPENPGGYPPPYPSAAPAPKPRQARPTPQPPAPRHPWLNFASMSPTRVALLIACALAVIFCMVEVGKIVLSLASNEQEMKKYREDYYAMAGVDVNSGNGVELLPQGQTYAPTATATPAQTPTATPRIDQNDPLIGVMDNGGVTQTTFQAALPTATPATRTRLTQYPNNALLSVSDDFTALLQENPDVMGRITIDGVLDEVFVKRNNTFYLTHNARGVFGSTGAVFVDESVVLKKPPENLLLRGQTNIEGKLFQPLLQYATAGGNFVASHGMITCNTLYEQARYVIFAIISADSVTNSPDYFNYAGYPTFQSDAQMLRYVENAKQRSLYAINANF
ncbi:MAG TPA: hypothetical protein PLP25_06560, partial [Candidatus Limiplasma sp.]|nr:hypothetical protein [Candidatus Limiplasma sp.]